jgi:tRNA pseudouridine55 synthase
MLGCGGHLSSLRRTMAGAHTLARCVSLDDIRDNPDAIPWVGPWEALEGLPAHRVSRAEAADLRNGKKLPAADAPWDDGVLVRVGTGDDELVAVAHPETREGVRIWKTDRVRPVGP